MPAPSNSRALAGLLLVAALLPGCSSAPSRPVASTPPAASAVATAPALRWQRIGTSVENRSLSVAQTGNGPLRVYLIGGVHGDEIEGRSAIEYLGQATAGVATLRILRDLNPDGTAANRRGNARDVDLNRNWPARNFEPGASGGPMPLSEPETRALEQDLRAFRPDLVIALHSTAIGPLVNYDGPAASLAAVFAEQAATVSQGWHVLADMGYPTNGSLGSYLGIDRELPILTIEFRRGQDEGYARAALQKGLPAVIGAAASARVAQVAKLFGSSRRAAQPRTKASTTAGGS